jgi:putative (di)nucleoside polyphosphate hydrolase
MAQSDLTTSPPTLTGLPEPERRRRSDPDPRERKAEPSASRDPDLATLLNDPDLRLVMRADRVDARELRHTLNCVRRQLGRKPRVKPANWKGDPRSQNYRRGVGIVLLNAHGEVFVGRRADVMRDAWQMPQGGIRDGESPRQAAMRELREEIGTDNAEIIAESKGWLYYGAPQKMAKKAWNGRWAGQQQKWFVMQFKGADSEINLDGAHTEFDAWRWVPVHELAGLAVSFKRKLYLDVIGEFTTIFRD